MNNVIQSHQELLNNFLIKGFILKQISKDLKPHLEGVIKGLCAQTTSDTEAIIYQIDEIQEDKVMMKPWFSWNDGVLLDAKGRRMSFYPYKPEGKSVGMFVSKSGKVAIPLIC